VRSWTVDNFKLYFQGAVPQLSGGNFKSGSNYFGGNVTGASHDGEGNYSSGLMTQGDQFGFKLQQLNAFTLRVQNSGGFLEHMIGAVGSPTTPTNVATSVRGARSTATRTPTGPDASTGFAAGVKLGNPGGDTLILDTGGGQWEARDSAFSANVSLNASGHACTVVAQVIDASVAGASRRRLHLTLHDAASGAAVPWASALARNGSLIDVSVMGFLR